MAGRSTKARRRRENAFREQSGKCWYCKCQMVVRVLRDGETPPPDTCTLEHTRPRGHPDRKAGDFKTNVAACWGCNQREAQKHGKLLEISGYNEQKHAVPHLSVIGGLMRASVMPAFLLED